MREMGRERREDEVDEGDEGGERMREMGMRKNRG